MVSFPVGVQERMPAAFYPGCPVTGTINFRRGAATRFYNASDKPLLWGSPFCIAEAASNASYPTAADDIAAKGYIPVTVPDRADARILGIVLAPQKGMSSSEYFNPLPEPADPAQAFIDKYSYSPYDPNLPMQPVEALDHGDVWSIAKKLPAGTTPGSPGSIPNYVHIATNELAGTGILTVPSDPGLTAPTEVSPLSDNSYFFGQPVDLGLTMTGGSELVLISLMYRP